MAQAIKTLFRLDDLNLMIGEVKLAFKGADLEPIKLGRLHPDHIIAKNIEVAFPKGHRLEGEGSVFVNMIGFVNTSRYAIFIADDDRTRAIIRLYVANYICHELGMGVRKCHRKPEKALLVNYSRSKDTFEVIMFDKKFMQLLLQRVKSMALDNRLNRELYNMYTPSTESKKFRSYFIKR